MPKDSPERPLNLDQKQQLNFVRFFKSLPAKAKCTVRFFERSDYYTVHDEDATFLVQEFGDRITSVVKQMGIDELKLSYLVIDTKTFEKVIRELLLVRQYRIEVYKKTSRGQSEWTLEATGSPGNILQFMEVLYDGGIEDVVCSNCAMCVRVCAKQLIAVCSINTTESTILLSEFKDDEFYTHLESVVVQLSPQECIIPQGESRELKTIGALLERNGIHVSTYKKKDSIDLEVIARDLNRLLYFEEKQQKNCLALNETKMIDAMSALYDLIKYLKLTEDERNLNLYRLGQVDFKQHLRLDSSASYALKIFPKPGDTATQKRHTLLAHIDRCQTPQGHRLLERWLKQPLKDIHLIQERLDIVEAIVGNSELRRYLRTTFLWKVPDLTLLAKKLSNKKATLRNLYAIYRTVKELNGAVKTLKGAENAAVNSVLMDPINGIICEMKKYQDMVEYALDLDAAVRDEFLVRSDLNEELKDLGSRRSEILERMQRCLQRAANDLNLEAGKSMKLERSDQHGRLFRITLREERVLRQNNNYTIVEIVRGGVRFTNVKLQKLNDDFFEVDNAYEREQKVIVRQIVDVASEYTDTLRSLNHLIGITDVLLSFAKVTCSSPLPYTRPKLLPLGSGVLRMRRLRHPCLERIEGLSYIPNDVNLDRTDGGVFSIITGPNMGGKSTYIRSVALASVMAQIGCFVPCEDPVLSIVDAVLARVGADDSLVRGVSTFMQEMAETSAIIRSATENTLVVIDELGRGTSTYDGCGLAFSIAKYIANEVRCYTLFATHFHEITYLPEKVSGVRNYHVDALVHDNSITPLYVVREGPSDESYGIHCAKLAGFPADVLENAQREFDNLECNKAMKYIKDYEPSLKREIVKEAERLILQASEKLKAADLNSMTDEDLKRLLEECRNDMTATGNLYIKGYLEEN